MRRRTSNLLSKITARAKRGDVEVEHLLPVVRLADPSAAAVLRELSATHHWPMMKRGFVPLGMWVECIATLITRGAGAVARGVKAKKLDGAVARRHLHDREPHARGHRPAYREPRSEARASLSAEGPHRRRSRCALRRPRAARRRIFAFAHDVDASRAENQPLRWYARRRDRDVAP
jgi:hypothetical protein